MSKLNAKWSAWFRQAADDGMIETFNGGSGPDWRVDDDYDSDQTIEEATKWAMGNPDAKAALSAYAVTCQKAKGDLTDILRFKVDNFDPDIHQHHPVHNYD